MKLTQCNSLGEWNLCIRHFAEANFLQSWQWGEFQQSLGKAVFRFVVLSGSQPIALVQVVREPAKRGAYFAIAGGPLLDWNNHEVVTFLFAEIKKLALQHNCVFIRFRPQVEQRLELRQLLHSIGAVTAPMHLTADLTIEIDLTKSDEELKAEMRKQHRQALKKATELGVHVQLSKNIKDLKQFYQEQLVVAQRQGFVPFSERFLTKQFEAFVADDQITLFHAYYEKTLLASAFVIFYNGEAVYHYGISTSENREYPGSYACQWAIIQEAKKRGCSRYNLWGVSPKDAIHHRFYGVGLFKRGFGGKEVAYVPAQDIPLNWKYWLTWIFETLRRKMRKL